jgi:hypothetical protein
LFLEPHAGNTVSCHCYVTHAFNTLPVNPSILFLVRCSRSVVAVGIRHGARLEDEASAAVLGGARPEEPAPYTHGQYDPLEWTGVQCSAAYLEGLGWTLSRSRSLSQLGVRQSSWRIPPVSAELGFNTADERT